MHCSLFKTGLFTLLITLASTSGAQQITTTAPLQNFGDSYYSFGGFNWGLSGPGWSLNVPLGNNIPAFGGADPNSGLQGGFRFGGGNINGNLGFNFGQGSRRFGSVVAPSVTTLDGVPGSIFSGTVRPFVTSITPVVGGSSVGNDSIRRAGVAREAAMLSDIAARKAQIRADKAYQYWKRGLDAEEEGDLKKARANYRLAFARASEPLRTEVARRLIAHGWKP